MDNTKRFDGKGEIYAKARPSYATELFDHIKSRFPISEGSIFADIGSGTGIFSEQLLNCGYRVYAVEPNTDMRQIAEERLSKYKGLSLKYTDVSSSESSKKVLSISILSVFPKRLGRVKLESFFKDNM